MTIRIYPSRLPGLPLETHEHGEMTIRDWMVKNVEEFRDDITQPISIEVFGIPVTPLKWDQWTIKPDSDVRIYPIPHDPVTLGWIAVGIAVASTAYSIFFANKGISAGDYTSSTGTSLDVNPAKANSAKLGDPIREVFGRYRIYPDYVVQPVTRFDKEDPTIMRVEMMVCLGVGNFSFSDGDIRVGSTPISSLGDGFSYTVYEPGASVENDERSENWFNSTEVGGTSSGSGLDMAQTAPESYDIIADSMTVSGSNVTFTGLKKANNSSSGTNSLPASWVAGTVVELKAPSNFFVTESSGRSVLSSDTITEIAPYIGMPVTLSFGYVDYDLFIASYTASQAAVPGVGGNTAAVQASAAPTTYDFSGAPITFAITWHGVTYSISLIDDYLNMSGVLDEITSALTGSGLIASDNGGTILISERSSPFAGGSITTSSLPVSVFGDSPVYSSGTTSTGGSAAVTASVTLAYGSAAGTSFTGIPSGSQRISLSHKGNEYKVTEIDGTTATIKRVIDGVTDESWTGFTSRTMVDYQASGINDSDRWMGPFLACPENEVCDRVEINFFFPSGICGFNNKGDKQNRTVKWEIQYRVYGSGGGWTSKTGEYNQKNINGLGFTELITLSSAGLVEVRCRRTNEQGEGNARDTMYWQALRGRLLTRAKSYQNVTIMGGTVETGGKLAAQSDRRVNIASTRNYDSGKSRSISAALLHVGNSLGLEMDNSAISALESAYWTPENAWFDFATTDSVSALEMLQKIAGAGKSYFLLSDGLASVGREGVKPWTGIITPHEMTEELQTAFSAPSDDDYDGVDVTYINGTTWAEETIQCRTSDNPTPVKVESYTLDGVLNRDQAYQIGMRRLMKYLRQRLTFTVSTELDALCYNVGDRIVLTDDIPGNKTVSCLVESMERRGDNVIFTVSEPLDWSFDNPRMVIRYQDGSASGLMTPEQIGDYQLSVPYIPAFDDIDLSSASIEPIRIVFCDSSSVGYNAIISEISPQSDGTCQMTAKEYRESFYEHDTAAYPGDVTA
ncbi:putative tail protein [Flyfo siphovirus Tbat2_3]|nr:putative tail protein [Flyfo siphovirus Tbat2_3]